MRALQAMKLLRVRNQVPTVGVMAAGAPGPIEHFRAGMRDCGFVDGQNVCYELRIAHGSSGMLFPFAVELVGARVDLIAVVGAVTARAARDATKEVPIVYAVVVDPIGDGLPPHQGNLLAT